ncbi:MAG TPA: hypothetical protein VMZ11_09340 [Mycobacteriales bacterium]|nr:hypothetical protein [Mycobacteriales bacterium]
MTTPVALPLTCPPAWTVRATARTATTRAATPAAPARTLRVPLVAPDEWFWDRVGADEVVEAVPAVRTDDGPAWGIVALPAALLAQVVVADLAQLAVPGVLLLAELAVALVLLARVDAGRLRAQHLEAPSPWAALLPPLYLFRRARLTQDVRLPLAWFGVAAAVTLATALVDARLAPLQLPSSQVEAVLYEQLFEGKLPLDARTGTISCPGFTERWVGQDFRCSGNDATHSIPVEVSVLDRHGALSWQALKPPS